MFVAPVEDVVAEDVGVHSQRRHARVLGRGGELAVLHGVAMIPAGVSFQHLFDGGDEDLGGLVPIAVAVHGEAGAVVRLERVDDLFGGHDPDAVLGVPLRRVVVVGPADPCREALDRSVDEQLDDAELQLVVDGIVTKFDNLLCQFVGVHRCRERGAGNHDSGWKTRAAGHRFPGVESLVGERCSAEIGHEGVARVAGREGEVPFCALGGEAGTELLLRGDGQAHGRRFLEFAVWSTVASELDARGRVGLGDLFLSEQCRVDGGEVAAGVLDENRPGLADRIEVVTDEALPGQIDRVEPPGNKGLGGVSHCCFNFAEPGNNLIDGLASGPDRAFRVASIEEADIGEGPHAAGHAVAVCLDEPRRDDMIAERLVDRVIAPCLKLGEVADAEDAVTLYGDRFCRWKTRIHRDHTTCRIDRELRHRCPLVQM